MKTLRHKVILITGATGGFGREFAKQLYSLDAHLILNARNKTMLEDLASQLSLITSEGRVLGLIDADLSTKKGCEELYNRCKAVTSEMDIIINNAGVIAYGHFHEIPVNRWEQLMETNLLAAMRLSYLFLPDMIKRGQGHIVLMSSVAGFIGTKNSTAYAASKFGLRGFGLSLYGEVKSKGINVTIIYPFWADTPLL
jgi:short-subunit dehydrogenase